jgi:hypothetical protein
VTDHAAVHALLRERGAETVEHPGGTLYAHLVRVADRLARLGCAEHVRVAGLAHAVYGTDGFDVVLVDPADRHLVRAVTGPAAEALVHRYGGCDRRRTWADLAVTRRVVGRFPGDDAAPAGLDAAALRDFVDLSVVNELDVVEQSPELAARHGAAFRSLFASWAGLGSPRVLADARRTLAAVAPE